MTNTDEKKGCVKSFVRFKQQRVLNQGFPYSIWVIKRRLTPHTNDLMILTICWVQLLLEGGHCHPQHHVNSATIQDTASIQINTDCIHNSIFNRWLLKNKEIMDKQLVKWFINRVWPCSQAIMKALLVHNAQHIRKPRMLPGTRKWPT